MPIKLIIIYYTWSSTASNHAGMTYLVNRLNSKLTSKIKPIEIPSKINKWNRIKRSFYEYKLARKIFKKYSNTGASILFMEFFGGHRFGNQTRLARYLFNFNFKGNLFGMVHLPPFKISKLYKSDKKIIHSLNILDKVIVMGSTLESYFNSLNITAEVIYTPHYVDNNFYKPAIKKIGERLQLISMGNLFRNTELLYQIVAQVDFVDFHICSGNMIKHYDKFRNLKNVTLYGFLDEDELLRIMQNADVGISVMEDTIGSNVIVTSLAVGLPQIVSNVGSIHDYCDTSNAVFCDSIDDFIRAITNLNNNRDQLTSMQRSALKKAEKIDIEIVMNWFKNELIDHA